MSLFEWIMEPYNPGPIGSLDFEPRERSDRSRAAVLTTFTISAAVLGGALIGMSRLGWVFDGRSLAIATGLTGLYLIAGYFIRPSPDTSNLGWCGGLIDNPFRYSDDFNRILLFLWLALLPGRFLSESLLDMGTLIARSGR